MAKPTKPKEIKPKAEVAEEGGKAKKDGGGDLGGVKLIAVNTVITLIICGLFIAANFFIIQNTVMPAIKQAAANGGGGDNSSDNSNSSGNGGDQAEEHGLILDLGQFILNLSDPKERRYLKINVALELSKVAGDPEAGGASGGKGGEGGGGEGGGADPTKAFTAAMSQYTPAIRDAVISTLSSKTAEELQSTSGKELAKEQIKEAVDAIFNGEREVIRVSFGDFIIQ